MADPCEHLRERAVEENQLFGSLTSMAAKNIFGGLIGMVLSLILTASVHPGFLIITIVSGLACANGVSLNKQAGEAREREDEFMRQYRECQNRHRGN